MLENVTCMSADKLCRDHVTALVERPNDKDDKRADIKLRIVCLRNAKRL